MSRCCWAFRSLAFKEVELSPRRPSTVRLARLHKMPCGGGPTPGIMHLFVAERPEGTLCRRFNVPTGPPGHCLLYGRKPEYALLEVIRDMHWDTWGHCQCPRNVPGTVGCGCGPRPGKGMPLRKQAEYRACFAACAACVAGSCNLHRAAAHMHQSGTRLQLGRVTCVFTSLIE